MEITRTSSFTGKVRTKDLDITEAQYAAYMGGISIQNAMPHLSADDREFILTGVVQEEWDAEFAGEDL